MEKQKILYQQARLHARGAAEMVLQMISASKGTVSWPVVLQVIYLLSLRFCSLCFSFSLRSSGRLGPMVTCTLKLGISILNGGNVQVQQVWNFSFIYFLSLVHPFNHSSNGFWFLFLFQKMLDYLKEKRDAGFFKSLSGLMQSCRWLNCVHKNKNKTNPCVIGCVYILNLVLPSSVSWTWMHLRDRTRQKVWAWWQRKVHVSEEPSCGFLQFFFLRV